MIRLRDLGLAVGYLGVGRQNAITDVEGVSVGQVEIGAGGLHSGLTAVVPYPADVGERRLFIGRYALDGGDGLTGLGVAEDFGTFSTPIVLAPRAAAGRVYDALIQYGLGRDPGLSTTTGWPPMVMGVDDTYVNPAVETYRQVGEEHVGQALREGIGGAVREGNAGIGAGLCAFGFKGGVGTASRQVEVEGGDYNIGVLVAANAGAAAGLCVDRFPLGLQGDDNAATRPQTFAAVVATDAPLLPRQLDRLAGRASLGLTRVGLIDAATREGVILAFSTRPPQLGEGEVVEQMQSVDEALLSTFFGAAAEAGEEAVLNALLAAEQLEVRDVALAALPRQGWPERLRRHQGRGGDE